MSIFKRIFGKKKNKPKIILTPDELRDLISLSDKIPTNGEKVILKLGDNYFKIREIGQYSTNV
jgi:hypothetical protein